MGGEVDLLRQDGGPARGDLDGPRRRGATSGERETPSGGKSDPCPPGSDGGLPLGPAPSPGPGSPGRFFAYLLMIAAWYDGGGACSAGWNSGSARPRRPRKSLLSLASHTVEAWSHRAYSTAKASSAMYCSESRTSAPNTSSPSCMDRRTLQNRAYVASSRRSTSADTSSCLCSMPLASRIRGARATHMAPCKSAIVTRWRSR